MMLHFPKIQKLVFTYLNVVYLNGLHTMAQVTNSSSIAVAPLPETPPDFPLIRSPMTIFQKLLNIEPIKQTKALTNHSEESRKRILAKIREYKSLKPNECELRLKVTELGYYVRWLMRTPGTNRTAQIKLIPKKY